MKTVLILRHAKSSWKQAGLADHDRPLNKRGKRDAPRIGRKLRTEGLVPDLILTSTAKRARATAEAVAEASGFEGEIKPVADFYEADADTYRDAVRRAPDNCRCLLLVGHNPGLEEFLEVLTGAQEHLPTAALARVKLLIKRWKDLNGAVEGKLVEVWRPREMD